MKIIIDISKKDYNEIKQDVDIWGKDMRGSLIGNAKYAIAHGISVPLSVTKEILSIIEEKTK